MPKLFFLLSGEHETLTFAELKAALESENLFYEEIQTLPQILRLNTTIEAIGVVKERVALTRVCCRELFVCQANFAEIVRAMQCVSLNEVICSGESFVVRIRRVGEAARELSSMDLERKLGELILDKVDGVNVNLKHPQKTFFGAITGTSFVFGLKLAEISPTPFMCRRPRKRPFFHPSSMTAKLARCMVNLARPKKGGLLLDPFCGTGSFLIEAGLLGCRVVGLDTKRKMVKGSSKNLRFFNIDCEGLAVADANHLPLVRTDCIVTDPPYGRSASTMGRTTKEIVEDFLAVSAGTLSKGSRICIASPKSINISLIGKRSGFKHVQSHFVHVHRSLTREITVLER